jgi:predicted DCC family thiol-disulfide oxidoreductase YuxK
MNTQALLVFDGYCGFCTRAVETIARYDRHHRLEIRAWQQPDTLERAALSREDVRTAAWLIHNGRRYRGAAAINAALSLVMGNAIALGFYGIPGVRQLQDWVYAWIAANRSSLRGVKAFCKRPGSDCESGSASCRVAATIGGLQ